MVFICVYHSEVRVGFICDYKIKSIFEVLLFICTFISQ